jgi:dihydroflavonol-4-reductase
MIGPYEQSKYDAEQLVLQAVQEKQLQAVVVNPPGPIGPYDIKPSPMGKVLVDFFKGNIPAYTDTGLNVVDVQDVVEGIWLAQHKGKIGERYLLGGTNLTLLEFLQLLESLSGKPAPRWRIPYSLTLLGGLFGEIWGRLRNQDPLANLHSVRMAKYAHWYDSSKAQEELGFQARDIRPALQAAIQWFREQNYIP